MNWTARVYFLEYNFEWCIEYFKNINVDKLADVKYDMGGICHVKITFKDCWNLHTGKLIPKDIIEYNADLQI